MFDDSILAINEIAKTKTLLGSGGGGGGAGTQFTSTGVPLVATAWFSATNLTISSGATTNNSTNSYTKAFNHGGGQFSFANGPTYSGSGGNQSQFFVKPFTVNQTTGAITEGTGSALWTNGTNGGFSTGTWGQGLNGQHCFHQSHSLFPGNSSNVYGTTAWTVSGNSVTHSTYTVNNTYATVSNEDSFVGVSGSNSYFVPGVYNGTAWRHVLSYSTNSSISNTSNQNLSSNTSTMYTSRVVPQFGTSGSASGSLLFYQDGSGAGQIQVLNSAGENQTTATQRSAMRMHNGASTQAVALELSNGRQLHYTNRGCIVLKNGTSLSDVTDSADWIPIEVSSVGRSISRFTPVSADTWFVFNPSVNEIVKFRINPTTYKVTIVGSKVITNLTNNERRAQDSGSTTGGAFVTGNNNQFIVAITPANTQVPSFTVTVGQNSLAGA